MDMRARKALGCFALLAYLAVYAAIAATLGSFLLPVLPAWAELIFYAVAGIIWILPLKPLFSWMNRPQ
jgi:predicted membrane channel-forming protein YqfA (hemolysin III family)